MVPHLALLLLQALLAGRAAAQSGLLQNMFGGSRAAPPPAEFSANACLRTSFSDKLQDKTM